MDYLPEQQLKISPATESYADDSLEVGEWVAEQIEAEDVGRISAQQAK